MNTLRRGILWLSTLDGETPVHQIFVKCPRHLHVTLQFGVCESLIPRDLLGRTFRVRATGNCYNHRVQALRVELPVELQVLCRNEVPHMTISMIPGVNPVESNEMLQGHHVVSPLSEEIDLICEFEPFN